MATKQRSTGKKLTVAKTTDGLKKTLFLIAGLFVGGLLEQYLMSKVAFLSDTKVDTTDATKTTKNTVGVLVKSAIYIVGGLIPGQITANEMVSWAGYGISSYGGLKAIKSLSDTAKVYGLAGGVKPYSEPQLYPNYPLPALATPTSR